jgi:hypothetical protein
MGVILDSSAVIAGERHHQRSRVGTWSLACQGRSADGAAPAVLLTICSLPFPRIRSRSTSRQAARINAESKREGVTALEFNYAVATMNLRHFEMIPNLTVKAL